MPPRFLTLEQVRDALAITDSMAYTLVRSGELPAIQVGPKRVWRVEAAKFEEYIERQYEATRTRVQAGEA
jgi:excisionase family DNA binding protein